MNCLVRSSRVPCVWILFAVAAIMLATTAAQAQTSTPYNISGDICIDSFSPGTNYDNTTSEGKKDQAFVDGPGSPTPVRTVFQLPSQVFGSNVTDAVATFVVSSAMYYNSSDPVMLYPLSEAYTPSAATWNTSDGVTGWAGGVYDTGNGAAVTGTYNAGASTYTFDLASLLGNPTFKSELQQYGAILMEINDYGPSGAAPAGDDGIAYRSSRYVGSGTAPYVQVTTVPEPSTVMLLLAGAGLAAAAFVRRRFR